MLDAYIIDIKRRREQDERNIPLGDVARIPSEAPVWYIEQEDRRKHWEREQAPTLHTDIDVQLVDFTL